MSSSSPDIFDLPESVKYDIALMDTFDFAEDAVSKSYQYFVDENMRLQQDNHRYSMLVSQLQRQCEQWQLKCKSQQTQILQVQQELTIQRTSFDDKFNQFLNCANDYDKQKQSEIQQLKLQKMVMNKKFDSLKTEYIKLHENYQSIQHNKDGEYLISDYIEKLINSQFDIQQQLNSNIIHIAQTPGSSVTCIGSNSSSISTIGGSPRYLTPKAMDTHSHHHNEYDQYQQQKQFSVDELKKIRIRQKNIVYVVGLPVNLCNAKLLKSCKWFGKFGSISRICFNTSPKCVKANSIPTFVTYTNEYDALQAIQKMNLFCLADGTRLKTNYGRTKYCPMFCEGQQCVNGKCKFLHQWAKVDDIITEQEINDFNAIRAGPPSRVHNKQ